MRRFFFVFCFLCVSNLTAQEFTTKMDGYFKTPDVHNFEKNIFSNFKGSSGSIDITIDLFAIEFEGTEVPINISYNSTGVKVNSPASRVGLNWNLNAGGFISREIVDSDDFGARSSYSDGCLVDVELGWLMNNPGSNPDPIVDGYPDIHRAYAPNLNSQFVYEHIDNTPLELNNNNYKIKTYYHRYPSPDLGYIEIDSVHITNTSGIKYEFSELEKGKYDIRFHDYTGNSYPHSDLLVPAFTNLNQYNTPFSDQYRLNSYISNYLTKIKASESNSYVEFKYENEYLFDSNRHIEFAFENNTLNNKSQKDFAHDLQLTKRLTQIKFNEGVINFSYINDRADLVGSKSLDKIELRDNFGNLIKCYNFVYSYFTNSDCQDPSCKRLKLDEIFISNSPHEKLPYYKFTYTQEQDLPEKYSLKQDYLGYCNSLNLSPQAINAVPILYVKPSEGYNSVLPFNPNIGSNLGYIPTNGNLSLEPILNFAKIGSLSSILLPSGGRKEFIYELNSFNFNNNNITAPGLRIAGQVMYDSNNTVILNRTYNYNIDSNNTSGFIIKAPYLRQYFSAVYSASSGDRTYQQNSADIRLTNNSFVSYKKITAVDGVGNGKKITFFTGKDDFPEEDILIEANFQKTFINNQYLSLNYSDLYDEISNGQFINNYFNNDKFYGSKIKEEFYDNNSVLKKSVEYLYNNKKNDSISGSKKYSTQYLDYLCDFPSRKTFYFPQKIYSHDLNLISKTEKDYFSNNEVINVSTYNYNQRNHLKDVISWVGNNDFIKTTNFYPYEYECLNEPFRQELIDKNIIGQPLITHNFKNNVLLSKSKKTYNLFNNKLLMKNQYSAKGNSDFQIDLEVFNYNNRGRVLEIKNKDQLVTSVIYDGTGISAASIITNFRYNQIDPNIISQFSSSFTVDEIQNSITFLKNSYPSKLIKSVIQQPFIGVTKIFEYNENTSGYIYDSFNRLFRIKESDNKILKEYTYNYQRNSPSNPVQILPLSGNITINYMNRLNQYPVLDNYKAILSAEISGGDGSYRFEWRSSQNGLIIHNQMDLESIIPCGLSETFYLRVVDDAGNILNLTAIQNSHLCDQPLACELPSPEYTFDWSLSGGSIEVNGIGGSGQYEYQLGNLPPSANNTFTVNISSCPVTFIVTIKIIDTITNEFVFCDVIVNVLCQGYEWDEQQANCFFPETLITMSDGRSKRIDEIKVNDEILSYNFEKNIIEKAIVDEISDPIHENFVRITLSDGTENKNTYDHPYYVVDKGWCSFNPKLTKDNYNLEVFQMEVGDYVLSIANKSLQEIQITNIEKFKKIVKTYNLKKVTRNNNFFANGILVHNKYNASE